jgi:hypothetical protein
MSCPHQSRVNRAFAAGAAPSDDFSATENRGNVVGRPGAHRLDGGRHFSHHKCRPAHPGNSASTRTGYAEDPDRIP